MSAGKKYTFKSVRLDLETDPLDLLVTDSSIVGTGEQGSVFWRGSIRPSSTDTSIVGTGEQWSVSWRGPFRPSSTDTSIVGIGEQWSVLGRESFRPSGTDTSIVGTGEQWSELGRGSFRTTRAVGQTKKWGKKKVANVKKYPNHFRSVLYGTCSWDEQNFVDFWLTSSIGLTK